MKRNNKEMSLMVTNMTIGQFDRYLKRQAIKGWFKRIWLKIKGE